MNKIILSGALCAIVPLCATDRSIQNMKNDITNTYKEIFQKKDVLTASYAPLRTLGATLDNYVMKKEGLMMGKKEAKPSKLASQKIHGLNNIFNVWQDNILVILNAQIDALQTLRVSPKDAQALSNLEGWKDTSWPLMRTSIENIQKNTIVAPKRKLCDVMLLFIDKNVELIKRALNG